VLRETTRPCGNHMRCPSRVWHARSNRATADDVAPAVVTTDSVDVLRPRMGEGRNTVLRRGRYASLVSESVQDREGSSGKMEE
jgi:hypothetical protein